MTFGFKSRSRLKKISRQVIVITGASSGIGLATAYSAAEKGARVVLVARNKDALAEAQRKIENAGGEAIFVVADVANQDDLRHVAQVANETYGGFDTWVNCAGVSIIGLMEDVSLDDHKRLFDTNFWGVVNGSMIAAEGLKLRGGAIINVGSLLSDMSVPLQGMYCASKHAIKGFTDSLRLELEEESPGISVTLIKPAAIATPFFQHAKNYLNVEPKAPPPVYKPEEVAYAIIESAQQPVRDIRVGGAGYMMAAMSAHAPNLMDWLNEKLMWKAQVSDRPKTRHQDNLHQAASETRIHGRDMSGMPSLYTRAALNPAASIAVAAVVGFAAYSLFGRQRATTLGKTAMAGANLLLPIQQAIVSKGLMKYLDRKAEKLSRNAGKFSKQAERFGKDLEKQARHGIHAVNENTDSLKKKALRLIKS